MDFSIAKISSGVAPLDSRIPPRMPPHIIVYVFELAK